GLAPRGCPFVLPSPAPQLPPRATRPWRRCLVRGPARHRSLASDVAVRRAPSWRSLEDSVVTEQFGSDSLPVAEHELEPGIYEALLTGALDKRLADLVVASVTPELRQLADAEAADRFSRHIAAVVTRAIEA